MKKLTAMLCMFALLVLSACGSKEYEQHIKSGMDALKQEQYKSAVSHFKKAEKAKSTDEIKQYVKATDTMQKSVQALGEGKNEEAVSYAEKIVNSKESSKVLDILKPKAKDLISNVKKWNLQIKEMNEKLEKARVLADEKKYEEAEAILKELSGTTSPSEQIQEIAQESTELWQQVVREKNSANSQAESGQNAEVPAPPKPAPGQKLTAKQAEDLIRAYMKIPSNSSIKVEQEQNNEKGHYVFHVYEEVGDPNTPHNATMGYYAVNPETGEVYNDITR
jgi:tetratricopeptide (TPR) repeat protein